MAAYMVAVSGLPLASIQIRHNKSCRCWDRSVDNVHVGLEDT
jgi:hypothetical protein